MRPRLKYLKNVDWKDRMFGIKCPHCNKRSDLRQNQYTRGYNNLCTQAMGDNGFYCMDCRGITFLTSYEDCRRLTPTWCDVYPDSEKRGFVPGYKHNEDKSRIPTHHSHKLAAQAAEAK